VSGTDRGGSELGRALARLRLSRGLSQEQLAHQSGVSVRTIRDLERGHVQRPRPTSVALLTDALAMTSAERAAFKDFAADLAVYAGVPRRPVPVVPCQLPADIEDFTGRDLALEGLYTRVRSRKRQPAAVLITAAVGKAGVGKTALDVHAAHQ